MSEEGGEAVTRPTKLHIAENRIAALLAAVQEAGVKIDKLTAERDEALMTLSEYRARNRGE